MRILVLASLVVMLFSHAIVTSAQVKPSSVPLTVEHQEGINNYLRNGVTDLKPAHVKEALSDGAQVDHLFYGQTPLIAAVNQAIKPSAKKENDAAALEIIELLLKAQANPNSLNKQGMTPLHIIFYEPLRANVSYQLIVLLIKYGADVNAKPTLHFEDYGPGELQSVLGAAISELKDEDPQAHEIIKLLIEHGADLNEQSEDGSSPLFNTIMRNRKINFLALLLKYPIDLAIIDDTLKRYADSFTQETDAKTTRNMPSEHDKEERAKRNFIGKMMIKMLSEYREKQKDALDALLGGFINQDPKGIVFEYTGHKKQKVDKEEKEKKENVVEHVPMASAPFVRTESEQTADIARTWGPLYREASDLIQTGDPANLRKATALIKKHGLKKGYLRSIAENSLKKVQQTREWQELYAALQD